MIDDFVNGLGKIVEIKADSGDSQVEGKFGIISIYHEYANMVAIPTSALLFDIDNKRVLEVGLGAIEDYHMTGGILDTEGLAGSNAVANVSEGTMLHWLEDGEECTIISTFSTKFTTYAVVDSEKAGTQIVPLEDLIL